MHRVSDRSPIPGPARLIGGAAAFTVLTAGGFLALARWRPPADVGVVLDAVSPGAALFLALLLPLDFLLGGLRYRLFFDGRIFPHVPLWHCVRANLANMFLGAITPAQTGGGPAQLYVLCRRGASLSQALVTSLVNFVATLVFLALGGLTALLLLPAGMLGGNMTRLMGTVVAGIAILVALVIASVVVQSRTLVLVKRGITALCWRSRRARRCGAFLRLTISREVGNLRRGWKTIASRGMPTVLKLALATACLHLNKYLMGFVLAWAIQGPVKAAFFGLQLLQNVVLYFAPTPGASGIAEASAGMLLNPVLAPQTLVVWVVGWRVLNTFVAAFAGMLVLLAEARRHIDGTGGSNRRRAA